MFQTTSIDISKTMDRKMTEYTQEGQTEHIMYRNVHVQISIVHCTRSLTQFPPSIKNIRKFNIAVLKLGNLRFIEYHTCKTRPLILSIVSRNDRHIYDLFKNWTFGSAT